MYNYIDRYIYIYIYTVHIPKINRKSPVLQDLRDSIRIFSDAIPSWDGPKVRTQSGAAPSSTTRWWAAARRRVLETAGLVPAARKT